MNACLAVDAGAGKLMTWIYELSLSRNHPFCMYIISITEG
jgi:hypothetical protein